MDDERLRTITDALLRIVGGDALTPAEQGLVRETHDRLTLGQTLPGSRFGILLELCAEHDLPVTYADEEKVDAYTEFTRSR